ncbi:FkbM family methyltransferase [Olivibacter sp. SDN3]|nr:FkbM family methyltransferase [Olivibacter sp. SDN3]
MCIPFENIILKHFKERHMDYCSIDTEGSELTILKSIDFQSTIISVFSIENTYKDNLIYQLLNENGYQYIQRKGEDDFLLF